MALTQRQREIEALKNSLLAPKPATGFMAEVAGANLNKFDRKGEEEDNKYQKNMDWGTPRLVTKNRALVMDPK